MWQYWLSKKPATVIFPMLNALAEFLIRNTPHLKKILQATYGHILLDEFQDTTFDQYRLLKSAFMNSGIPVTAAGDEKQNIMLWANAMPDGMEQFINDFNAKEINLQWNFRSAPRLAELQNVVARKLLLDTLPESIPVNTDLDGTLYKNDKTISEKNKTAIAHFKSEGGLFTFVTGRMPYYSMAAYEAVAPNAPFGCINGGGVYDGEAKKYIEAKTLPPEALALVAHIDQCVSKVGIQICCLENTYFCKERSLYELFT